MTMLLSIFLLFYVSETNNGKVGISVSPQTHPLLIINSFDAQSMNARKNKKALFSELADSLKTMLKLEFERKQNREVIIVPGLINNSEGKDSVYIELINKYSATQAVVIKNLNAYFEQTGVEVTKESDGKKRVASYDINADVTYLLYNNAGIMRKTDTKVFEFFTERSVASGLLAAGPDIVGKSKHAFKIVQKNAEQYLREIKFDLVGE